MGSKGFFKWVEAVILISVLIFPAGAFAADITLKLGHEQPPGSPYDEAALKFAERVAINTKGKVAIKIFNNSQFGSPQEHFAQLKAGAIDLHVTDVGAVNMIEAEPKNFMVTIAPYLFDSQAQFRTFAKSDLIKTMMAKVEKASNLKYVGYIGDRAARGFSTTNRKVSTPDEMKGLKLRVAQLPLFVATYKAWGATPTPVVTKEIYTSLKSGMVDGLDWDIISIYTAKYYEIQKYFTAIEWMRSGIGLFANAKRWGSFPEDMRKAFTVSANETETFMNDWTAKRIGEAERVFKAAGTEVIHPDLKKWKAMVADKTAKNEGKVWEAGLLQKVKAVK